MLPWWNAELGTISPVQFIRIAEETGLIIPIGKWVLESACQQHVAWRERGLQPISMSVNLSPRQFSDPQLFAIVESSLEEEQGAPLRELHCDELQGFLFGKPAHPDEVAAALKRQPGLFGAQG